MKRNQLRSAFLLTLAMCSNVTVAQQTTPGASAPDASSSTGLEEIVVVAQRRSENLQRVPIAVTAVPSERLNEAGIQNTQDLAAVVPGLTFPSDFNQALPHLRGIGSSNVGPGEENSVAVYVDGVYYASSTTDILELNNIAQIEVLKGPQGTLFGRNATGGLIQVITKDPTATPSIDAQFSYGNYNTALVSLYASSGISETLTADFAVQASHQGTGWGENLAIGEPVYKMDRDISARSKFVWKPSGGTKVALALDYEDYRDSQGLGEAPGTASRNPFYPASAITLKPYDVNIDTAPVVNHQGGGVSLRIDQDFSAVDFVSISAARRSKDFLTIDFDLGPAPLIFDITNQSDEQFSQEFQLRSATPGPLTWTTGLFYFYAKSGYDPLEIGLAPGIGPSVGPGASLTNFFTRAYQEAKSLAGYAQATYEVVPTYNLTAGFRMTNEKRSFIASEDGLINGAIPVPLLPETTPSFSVNKPTWRLALDHQFTSDVLGYVSYSRGFKSGGYNPGSPTTPPYQTEQLDAYEVGLKSESFDHRLRLNSAVFYYDYSNIQVTRFVNGTPIAYNGAGAQVYGLDLDLQAKLTEKLSLDAGIEELHDRFTNFPCASYFAGGPQLSSPACSTSGVPELPYQRSAKGSRLPSTPDTSASVTIAYKTDLFGGHGDFSITDAYNSGFFFEPNNDPVTQQRAYNLINGSVKWTTADEHFMARLWVRNMTNEHYATELASAPTGIAVGYAAPRTYGLTVGVKY